MDATPSGSYLIVSQPTRDVTNAADTYNSRPAIRASSPTNSARAQPFNPERTGQPIDLGLAAPEETLTMSGTPNKPMRNPIEIVSPTGTYHPGSKRDEHLSSAGRKDGRSRAAAANLRSL